MCSAGFILAVTVAAADGVVVASFVIVVARDVAFDVGFELAVEVGFGVGLGVRADIDHRCERGFGRRVRALCDTARYDPYLEWRAGWHSWGRGGQRPGTSGLRGALSKIEEGGRRMHAALRGWH